MSANTTTEITFYVAPDSFDSADPAHNDIAASLDAYADELDTALTEQYPDARIAVSVAFGTTSAWAGDNDITSEVASIAASVFERNNFWVAAS